jgi:hypothetical protein
MIINFTAVPLGVKQDIRFPHPILLFSLGDLDSQVLAIPSLLGTMRHLL